MSQKKRSSHQASASRNALLPVVIAIVFLLTAILFLFDRSAPPEESTSLASPTPAPNPYQAGDFQYEGGYLTCTVANARLGLDISEHQPVVDWEQVREAGIEFAILRIGYRGYTEGKLFPDSCFAHHLAAARDAGLDVGVYFFSQAVTPAEAEEEAHYLLGILNQQSLDFPVVFDWEFVSDDDARTATMDARTLTDCALAFCQTIEQNGYRAMIYFNQDQALHSYILDELGSYDFWLAMYDTPMTFPYRVQMWQYTASGTVPGIDDNVDLNLYLP